METKKLIDIAYKKAEEVKQEVKELDKETLEILIGAFAKKLTE